MYGQPSITAYVEAALACGATVTVVCGPQVYTRIPLKTLLVPKSGRLLRAMHDELQSKFYGTREYRLAFPDRDDGTLFKYVLCYLEDPEGFVLPKNPDLRFKVFSELRDFGVFDDDPAALEALAYRDPGVLTRALAMTCKTVYEFQQAMTHCICMSQKQMTQKTNLADLAARGPEAFATETVLWTGLGWDLPVTYSEVCRKAVMDT